MNTVIIDVESNKKAGFVRAIKALKGTAEATDMLSAGLINYSDYSIQIKMLGFWINPWHQT